MLLLGIVDFGRYFFVQHTLQYATREGTRLALVGGTLTDSSGNPLSRQQSIVQMIKDNVSMAVNPNDVNIYVYPLNADYSDPSNWQQQEMPAIQASICG